MEEIYSLISAKMKNLVRAWKTAEEAPRAFFSSKSARRAFVTKSDGREGKGEKEA